MKKAIQAMEEAFIDVFPASKPYLKGLVEAKCGKTWAETKQVGYAQNKRKGQQARNCCK